MRKRLLARLRVRPTRHARRLLLARTSRTPRSCRSIVPVLWKPASKSWLNCKDRRRSRRLERCRRKADRIRSGPRVACRERSARDAPRHRSSPSFSLGVRRAPASMSLRNIEAGCKNGGATGWYDYEFRNFRFAGRLFATMAGTAVGLALRLAHPDRAKRQGRPDAKPPANGSHESPDFLTRNGHMQESTQANTRLAPPQRRTKVQPVKPASAEAGSSGDLDPENGSEPAVPFHRFEIGGGYYAAQPEIAGAPATASVLGQRLRNLRRL